MDEDVCDLVSYQIMVDARALGDTATSKELQSRVQLPEHEVATWRQQQVL
jgi:hypothetical protein